MELREVKQDELFHNGNLVQLGNYFIGSEITFGIHIPVYTRPQAKVILKQIQEWKEKAKLMTSIQEMLASTGLGPDEILEHFATQKEKEEKWNNLMKQYGVSDCKPEDIMNYITEKRNENKQLTEELKSVKMFSNAPAQILKKSHQKLEKIKENSNTMHNSDFFYSTIEILDGDKE